MTECEEHMHWYRANLQPLFYIIVMSLLSAVCGKVWAFKIENNFDPSVSMPITCFGWELNVTDVHISFVLDCCHVSIMYSIVIKLALNWNLSCVVSWLNWWVKTDCCLFYVETLVIFVFCVVVVCISLCSLSFWLVPCIIIAWFGNQIWKEP